ncbi:MAG: hypothetical protein JXA66_06135, partial [Oligoflexia bacterium]|nr:hypothetical protein [Oligoflexia bacterium]
MKEYLDVIGKPFPSITASRKVRGAYKFATDYYPQDLLHVKPLVYGGDPAEIESLDVSNALRLDGVVTIFTEKDNKTLFDMLSRKDVQYTGRIIAVVCASDMDSLKRGLDLVTVKYKAEKSAGRRSEKIETGVKTDLPENKV